MCSTLAMALGVPREQLDRDGMTELRQRAIGWVQGLTTKVTARSRTSKPRDRALAIAECGRPTAVYSRGKYWIAGKACGDRACPRCAFKRSRGLAVEMREVAQRRRAHGRTLWFVTLTQPKPNTLAPAVAIDSAMRAWRRLTNPKTSRGASFHAQFSGCVRAMEVTWSPRGKRRRDGSVVPYDGWHAHFHVLLEGGSRSSVRWLLDEWSRIVGGNLGAQDAQLADDRRIGQLCKYVVKPLVQDVPVHLCRELFAVLHGRRLCEGLGSWKGWRSEIERPEPQAVLWCTTTADKLAAMAASTKELPAPWRVGMLPREREVVFMRRVGDQVEEHAARVCDVLDGNAGWLAAADPVDTGHDSGPTVSRQRQAGTGPP
jgi:hypothetical protein